MKDIKFLFLFAALTDVIVLAEYIGGKYLDQIKLNLFGIQFASVFLGNIGGQNIT